MPLSHIDLVSHLSCGHRRHDLAVLVPPSRCVKALEDNHPDESIAPAKKTRI